MSQIVKKQKTGRPSRPDLARRSPPVQETDLPKLRRSVRRRSLRYNYDLDYDHFLDDYEDDDDEEEDERLEKKLKLVVKLPPYLEEADDEEEEEEDDDDDDRTRKVSHALLRHTLSGSPSVRKRRIYGCDHPNGGVNGNDSGLDDAESQQDEDSTGVNPDSATATRPPSSSTIPLPDKKTLELILDKLQKKDTYGVYTEPVDPEELPDYHEIIQRPMDYSTVRKNLSAGSYLTLEQFQSDVFLICSNAMQYNAPDTVYYKQARSMQDLAIRKFQALKIEIEQHKPQEKPNGFTRERPRPIEGGEVLFSDTPPPPPLPLVKALPKFGRKVLPVDESRRWTYSRTVKETSTVMEGQSKELIAVGFHTQYSYARSLARFAAALGPVAWNAASKKIKRGVPPDTEIGRGWVDQYEPPPSRKETTVRLVSGAAVRPVPGPGASHFVTFIPFSSSRRDDKVERSSAEGVNKALVSVDSLYGSARETFPDAPPDRRRPKTARPWINNNDQQEVETAAAATTLPPDLNIGFQPVDSQQPDLALQL